MKEIQVIVVHNKVNEQFITLNVRLGMAFTNFTEMVTKNFNEKYKYASDKQWIFIHEGKKLKEQKSNSCLGDCNVTANCTIRLMEIKI